jgi:adenosine kinase
MGIKGSKCDYFGAVGAKNGKPDERGRRLKDMAEESGVTPHFCHVENKPTGTCAVVVSNKERTLTTDLAAACAYNEQHFHANIDVLAEAKFIYITGFFISSSMPTLLRAAKYANDNDIPFGFNLSAVFLQHTEKENVLKALEYADFVFGNEDEAGEMRKTLGMPANSTLVDAAIKLASYKKRNTKRRRFAIVTYGPRPVIVARWKPFAPKEQVAVRFFKVPSWDTKDIVDTNGCGDSFVGGFLAAYLLDRPVPECVAAGNKLASRVAKQVGCNFPEKIDFGIDIDYLDKITLDAADHLASNVIACAKRNDF